MFYNIFFSVMLLFTAFSSFAQSQDGFLDPNLAFKFSAKMLDDKTITVRYDIAPGYYMYRERFKFSVDGAKLGTAVFPDGKIKFDENFQKNLEIYHDSVTLSLPVESTANFVLHVTGQGCAEKGLCYPPMTSTTKFGPKSGGIGLQNDISATHQNKNTPLSSSRTKATFGHVDVEQETQYVGPQISQIAQSPQSSQAPKASHTSQADQLPLLPESELGKIASTLQSGQLHLILPWFVLLGLGLSLTPCLLPMVPILSFMIVGEGTKTSRSRAFGLSVAYSLGMALVYTCLGVTAGLLGTGLSAALQNPWVLGIFALLMVGLSLSMFGVYQLQLPSALQTKLMQSAKRQSAGKVFGVFAMGAISSLIVGPCVAAPLAGTLIYIGQTRDVLIGGSALFAMAMGMSVPLLLVGLSAGSLLPRAGVWMEKVKQFFGVLMLGMALWLVSSIFPIWLQMLAWASLALGYGFVLLRDRAWIAKGLGVMLLILGVMEGASMATGGRDVWAPWAHLSGKQEHAVKFTRIKSSAELDAALAQAKSQGKIAAFDFYADWCVSCKEMERFTFTDAGVKAQLANLVLLQVDVTANNPDDQVLLKRFNLFGPPALIFFDKQGNEIQSVRVIGYQSAEKFSKTLSQL